MFAFQSTFWNSVAAFGYGVLLALALSGAVRMANGAMGLELAEEIPGHVFLIASLTFGSLFVFFYRRSLKRTAAHA